MGRPLYRALHVLTGHEEFILGDAGDGVTNAVQCDENSLLIAIHRKPYEISMAAGAQRVHFRGMPVGVRRIKGTRRRVPFIPFPSPLFPFFLSSGRGRASPNHSRPAVPAANA